MRELSIILPAYNEANKIYPTLTKLMKFCTKFKIKHRIIIINDGSTDQTLKLSKTWEKQFPNIHLYSYQTNTGKGYAIMRGVEYSREYYPANDILFMDFDLSTELNAINRINRTLNRRITIADRNHPDSYKPIKQGKMRETLGKIFPKLVNTILELNIRDTQCGFKYFPVKTQLIFDYQTITNFAFDVELLFIAKIYKIDVHPIKVEWTNNTDSKVKPFQDGMKMMISLLKIRRNYRNGTYGKKPTIKTIDKRSHK